MKRLPLLAAALLLSLLCACEPAAYEGPAVEEVWRSGEAPPDPEPAGDEVTLTLPDPAGGRRTLTRPRMITVVSALVVRVDDFDQALGAAREALDERHGYLAQLSYLRPGGEPAAGWLLYRLETTERDELLERLEPLGEVLREERLTSDVSRDYYTAELQLQDLRAQIAAFERQIEETPEGARRRQLLTELNQLENQAAAVVARFPGLEGHPGTAPVYLTLTAEAGLVADPAARLTARGFSQGYLILLHILRVLIIVVIVGAPLVGLALLVILPVRRRLRRRRPRADKADG
ncbi:MAG: DUF4349 domain-containing protein [Candidatus Coatesbacteria bacterium]|nr:DUF4349 domain-containing protein [Candidatus Coatesbacteria bacterium]